MSLTATCPATAMAASRCWVSSCFHGETRGQAFLVSQGDLGSPSFLPKSALRVTGQHSTWFSPLPIPGATPQQPPRSPPKKCLSLITAGAFEMRDRVCSGLHRGSKPCPHTRGFRPWGRLSWGVLRKTKVLRSPAQRGRLSLRWGQEPASPSLRSAHTLSLTIGFLGHWARLRHPVWKHEPGGHCEGVL